MATAPNDREIPVTSTSPTHRTNVPRNRRSPSIRKRKSPTKAFGDSEALLQADRLGNHTTT
ncbi:hypothetical protein [Nodularia spumigena]|uniref:hypothetical protein n=1 Tax=Nodularia spumigena TaxID=70799 RepID=UPI00232F4DD5|nr:hypothetical protein [Nodularia spumigena]MDB9317767.1 hypothetical protein [Nodularia spumigena CS-590/01A]MDB9321465.1 hypothetical protein [Nodularia spumigena CS-591/07A]MDB9331318.1 hypothetical protein [Nodularia spumigena CS-591/04]MDB9339666.1 hypothetical protein [Nodularia spumigena CS-589/07]MDB9355368.1 hypothetical protein [Nodularia spumigena CS-587/03]